LYIGGLRRPIPSTIKSVCSKLSFKPVCPFLADLFDNLNILTQFVQPPLIMDIFCPGLNLAAILKLTGNELIPAIWCNIMRRIGISRPLNSNY